MKQFLILLVLPLFFSCEEPIEEVIDLTDIIEGSENYKEREEVAEKIIIDDTLLSLTIPFNEKGFQFIAANQISRNLLPDRFGPVSRNKIELVSIADTINYWCWSYADSIKTMNAFYNWIDNFGANGKSIFIGEKTNFQSLPFIVFVGDTSITFIESNLNLPYSEWESYCSNGEKLKDWNYSIEQREKSIAKWFTYKENSREEMVD